MIVIVDDDVWFAEELQDLLILQGYASVVVVSRPEGSSLALLRDAQVLIIDVLLGATTVMSVLEQVCRTGEGPKVIMMSGGGTEVINGAVNEAASRGFVATTGMEKSELATELPGLLSQIWVPATPVSPAPLSLAEDRLAAASVGLTSVVAGTTLKYVGARVKQDCTFPSSLIGTWNLVGTGDRHSQVPEKFIGASLDLQRTLELNGNPGLLFTPAPEALLRHADYRQALCRVRGSNAAALSRIVLEMDISGHIHSQDLYEAVSHLRLAGFGVLLRCSFEEQLPTSELATIPITVLEIAEPGRRDQRALSETMRMLRKRAIGAMCKVHRSLDDLEQLRGLGFGLLDTGREISLPRGDREQIGLSLAHR